MKKTLTTIIALIAICLGTNAATLSSLSWANVCSGSMGAAWYGSEESQAIADIVLNVQKNSGGWMKNDELHKLTDSKYTALKNSKSEHSCLDNVATTQEMRFLAKVYQGCKVEKYRESFVKALNMILTAQMTAGGWGQYWPLSESGSYQNYITFNDDLTVNALKILRDVYENRGDFLDLVDETTREKCRNAFDLGLQCIIKCQVNDNGTPAAWCAQHDPSDYLPTEGRPHELPSISGYESANLLSFLMTVENPSEELQNTITSAIKWLDAHKYMDNAKVEDYTNTKGEADRHVVSAANSAVWGRFIQIGGNSGRIIYTKLFNKLNKLNKKRSYTQNGITYTYSEYEIASKSYSENYAYQPIYAIYDDTYQHLYYRFLYNYEDADSITDWKDCTVPTSLNALRRTKYQFLGSWCYRTINEEYPAWKQKMDIINNSGEATPYEISATTNTGTNTTALYNFRDGFTVANSNGKSYGTGKNNTVKYSAGVKYTINLPKDMNVVKATFYGYDNYKDADAYISEVNGTTFASDAYVFPQKDASENATYVSNTVDLSNNPASGTMSFTVNGKQCCLIITLYCVTADGIETVTTVDGRTGMAKRIENNKMVIEKNGNTYNAAGKKL